MFWFSGKEKPGGRVNNYMQAWAFSTYAVIHFNRSNPRLPNKDWFEVNRLLVQPSVVLSNQKQDKNYCQQRSKLVVAEYCFRSFFEWTKTNEYSQLNNRTIQLLRMISSLLSVKFSFSSIPPLSSLYSWNQNRFLREPRF